MLGLLNVNKPVGITSRDVVNQVQRLVKPWKVGHAGTLDPLASGVLVLAVGKATRLIKYVQRMPKLYQATFLLGYESDTEDVSGVLQELTSAPVPTREELLAQLPKFTGEIMQRPPAYSALKVKGERAYALARKGQDVALDPRPVQVYQMELLDYEFPQFSLSISCGTGTYIRSLGRDLAQSLGTVAVMETLVRRSIGSLAVEDAVLLKTLHSEGVQKHLLPVTRAVEELPSIVLEKQFLKKVEKGQPIQLPSHCQAQEVALCDEGGDLLAILVDCGTDLWRPFPNLLAQ